MNVLRNNSTRFASRSLLMAAVASLALIFASAANATQIDFGPFESEGSILLNIDGHDVSIHSQTVNVDLSHIGSGENSILTLQLQTIVFHTEPVVLNGLTGQGSGFAVVRGESGIRFANLGSTFDNVLVSSVTRVLSPFVTNGVTGLDVTFGIGESVTQTRPTPSNPVPEPSAALLFAVGLTAAGSRARRER